MVAVRIKLIIEELSNKFNEARLFNFRSKISNGQLLICNEVLKKKA